MDATPTSGNGFDAALKALEDLETGGVSGAEASTVVPPAATPAPGMAIGLSGLGTETGEPAAITALPFIEVELPALTPIVPEPAPPAADHPLPPPAAAAVAPASGRFGRIVVGLALFSSLVSAAGLIVAERTIMSAQLVVADARERAHQLERANRLIRDLELVRGKQIELLRRQQLQAASTPVTSAELQHRLDVLQTGLIQRDPLNRVAEVLQASHASDSARFNDFTTRLARIEAALGH